MRFARFVLRFGVNIVFAFFAAATAFGQTAPIIYNLPPGITVNSGDSFNISPSISGTEPITYQWKLNSVNISGATSRYYSNNSAATADSGQYTLTATNAAGSSTSSIVVVTVNPATAPVILELPASINAETGGSISLSASVYGTAPITLQWKKSGVNISGATSAYLYVGNVTTADSGQYALTATNSVGTTTSTTVVVTVNPAVAPIIATLPSGLSVNYGETLNLSAYVSGTAPITYQWKKDGVNIAGATSAYLSKGPMLPADAGQYTLAATNSVATTTSTAVVVTVNAATAPVVYGLSSSVTVNSGDNLYLYAYLGSGTQPVTYQWKKDGVVISGANSLNYTKSSATVADAGEYTLIATNTMGTNSISSTVAVNPATPPTITGMPASLTVSYGGYFTLSPSVTGTAPITYQWKKGGVNISGATSGSYSKNNATPADSGQYTLAATNSVDTTTSTAVAVTVSPAVAPTISGLPPTLTLNYGDNLSLYPNITGTAPFTYQWKKDGVNISGATNSSYYKGRMLTADAGAYTLTVTNSVGSTTSAVVTVTVKAAAAPAISGLPAVVTVNYGDSFSIYPTISGTSPMTYQWKKDGVNIVGATGGSYSRYGGTVPADSGQYTITVTNEVGTVTSSAVTVTVNSPVAPAISGLPSTLTLNYGQTLSLSASVTGTAPMTLQWKKGGAVIPGANGTSCNIGNTTTADSGQYTLTAINSSGTATATVTVTVNAAVAPVILNLPTALTLSYGGSLYLGAAVGGTQPMTLQWKKDGNVLPGMNGSSLNKSGVTPSDSGQYTLTATNVTGTVVSSAVTVTVNAAVAPAVFDLPATLTLEYGYNLNLSGTYTGTAPISFQWNKDGVAITDQINAYFSKSYVTTADSGQYTVTLTNMAGSATSSAVAVVVNPAVPPAITQQPLDQTVIVGDPVTLSVGVTGTAPFTYQWYFNDAVIPGEVSVTLGIASARASNGGTYKVVVSNPGGTVTSNSATLTIASQLGIVAAAAGTSHTLFIRSDGGLWGLGSNTSGQINNGVFDYKHYPVFISPNVAVATAGTGYSLFVKSDGTLWAMGDNSYGQLGDGTTATRTVPVQIASSVVGVSAGSQHSLFVKADGTLWAMGNNSSGQLGDGTFVSRKSPVQVATDVTFASAGSAFSCFITSDGTLWGMGSNSTGQLGDGTSVSRSTPGQIATGVTSVSAGYSHVLFIKSDGSLWGVGYTSNGQLGDAVPGAFGTPFQVATNVTDASAGQSHSLMVKSDATVMGMGTNYSGQLGDGSSIQHYTPVTIDTSGFLVRGGPNFSVYLNTNGSLLGMGDNYSGEIGGETYAYYSPKSIAAGPLSVTTAPGGVTATDGTLVQETRVTWTSRLGASWYEVWRGNINNSGSATRIASKVLFPLFYDVTATPGSTYYYWVKAVNPIGTSAFSEADTGMAASATPPAITLQPVSQNVFAGTAVTLSVSATGLPAPTYQWRKNGVNIAGATGSTYVIGSVSASAAGTYSVVASNAYGTADSLGGILTVKTLSGSDFNNDAQGDIVWQNTVTGERFIWLMSGVSHVGGVSLGVVDAAWSIAATADFNSDGSPDLLWQNSTTGERYVWFMSGGGHMGGASLGVVPLAWSIVGATDFNGDGKPDILWQNTTTGERYIWFMNGAGHVSDASLGTVPTAWSIVAAADFNSDGEADILWQNTTTGERYIWLMNGAGHVADLSLGIVDLSWSIAAAVDFSNDGQTDILWENTSTGQRYLWLMNGVAHQSDIDLGNMSTDWKIVR